MRNRYKWAAPGDVNAFFGLMLDNIAGLLLTCSLLAGVFEFPTTFVLRYMIPGTAIGVLVGDLLFFGMAFALAKKTGRNDITAMPLGLDTPSTFGMVFFVLGPAFLAAKASGLDEHAAATLTWHIGICSIFISGLFKFVCAIGSGWIRKVVPRAGLLGSLAAIALILISFLPLLEALHNPVVGFVALAIILTTLVAKVELPFKVPGALGALLVAGAVYYLMRLCDITFETSLIHLEGAAGFSAKDALFPTEWTTVFTFQWLDAIGPAMQYLPIVIPFALGTVIGGIDCTESAAAVGDEYNTGQVIAVEGFATLVASLFGGVIQTTPYIGHPAYKSMGGRAAYTLATALFIGSAGLLGYFGFFYLLIPKQAVFPILIFIGIEITAQSFHATPKRHYGAIVFGCIPALAAMVLIFTGELQGQYMGKVGQLSANVAALESLEVTPEERPALESAIEKIKLDVDSLQRTVGKPDGPLGGKLETMHLLSGGFIISSLLWASILASIIDRRLAVAAIYLSIAAAFTFFGIIHSPMPGSPMFFPWQLEEHFRNLTLQYTAAYLCVAVLMVGWGKFLSNQGEVEPLADDQVQFENET